MSDRSGAISSVYRFDQVELCALVHERDMGGMLGRSMLSSARLRSTAHIVSVLHADSLRVHRVVSRSGDEKGKRRQSGKRQEEDDAALGSVRNTVEERYEGREEDETHAGGDGGNDEFGWSGFAHSTT